MAEFNSRYWLFVADLDPAVCEDPRFTEAVGKYNPGRDPEGPYVYVSYTGRHHPTVTYADGDFSAAGTRLLRRYGQVIRGEDVCTGNRTGKLGILRLVDRTMARLRGRGWTVLNEPPPRDHHVYVLRLKDAAGNGEKARRLNPDADPDMPCLYVGQSSLPPEARLERHLSGERASSSIVRDHFECMLPGFYEHLNPMTERESLEKEEALARELRACGYTVIWS